MIDLAVIMSVYQNDRLVYLEKSVKSILTQTYSQFDYYIVFDGPVSSEIDNYISSLDDNRIHLYRLEKNTGLANALNCLLKIIIGDHQYKFIARMDADDISVESRFEYQRNFFLTNPGISCIGSWYQEIDEFENILSDQKLPVTHEKIKKFFMRRSPFAHPSVMFRREVIEKAGFYPTNTLRLEDYVFWSNAIKSGLLFANIPKYLLLFRRDKDFYKRRSGIRFGFNYIKTRFNINKTLKAPIYIYFYSVGIGLFRMMPAFVIRFLYLVFRK
jgi:glycosyltransferase involved in cell wall biosynthesis